MSTTPEFPLTGPRFTLRRKLLSVLHKRFRVRLEDGSRPFASKARKFCLSEACEIASTSDRQAVVSIREGEDPDFGSTFDICDARNGEFVGSLRRHDIGSLARANWSIQDSKGNPAGEIHEDHLPLAVIRRFLSFFCPITLLPQSFHLTCQGNPAGKFQQNLNPFTDKLRVRVTPSCKLDNRLLLAAAILVASDADNANLRGLLRRRTLLRLALRSPALARGVRNHLAPEVVPEPAALTASEPECSPQPARNPSTAGIREP